MGGLLPLGHFSFALPEGQAVRTLFTRRMLERGFLATGAFYAMLAHEPAHVARYLEAADAVFAELAARVGDGTVAAALDGPVAHSGFHRLT